MEINYRNVVRCFLCIVFGVLISCVVIEYMISNCQNCISDALISIKTFCIITFMAIILIMPWRTV